MTYSGFLTTLADPAPLSTLTPELQALWFCKNERWEESHNLAQDIPSATGSWIHALLHLIEGDLGNAAYWFHQAQQPVVDAAGIDTLWETIARSVCRGS